MPLCRRPSIWCDDVEVHAPDHPVLTLKQAAVHLAIVTAGVLIALSFEGILEWSHHRSLVREAEANLTTELQVNKRVYDRQALFNKVQDDVLSSALSAASLGLILDFQKASPAELQDVKRQLRLALGNVFAVEEIGRALAAAYDRALDESN
jgi:hypothetical protein